MHTRNLVTGLLSLPLLAPAASLAAMDTTLRVEPSHGPRNSNAFCIDDFSPGNQAQLLPGAPTQIFAVSAKKDGNPVAGLQVSLSTDFGSLRDSQVTTLPAWQLAISNCVTTPAGLPIQPLFGSNHSCDDHGIDLYERPRGSSGSPSSYNPSVEAQAAATRDKSGWPVEAKA